MSYSERDDALITAIRTDEVNKVQQALESGERLDSYSRYGETPLGVAASIGNLEIMRLLLTRGADPDEEDYEGDTAIEHALMHNDFDAIDLLLDWGTPEAQALRAVTALVSAASYCSLSLVVRLIDLGVDVNGTNRHGMTALIEIVVVGHNRQLHEEHKIKQRRIIRLLLEHGADVNKRFQQGIMPAALTAMYYAADNGDLEAVALLCQAGAEITLTEAAAIGDCEAVRLLLDQGQDPNWRDVSGKTALFFAAQKGHAPVVRLLLARGADPCMLSGREGYERTAFAAASDEGQTEIISMLLQVTLGINLNMRYTEISERLDGASGRAKLLELLLGPGGEQSTQRGYDGLTPLMEAAHDNNVMMLNLLLGAGCDVNVGNDVEYTALIIACERGALAAVRLLLEAGADPNHRNAQGNTALICTLVPGADKDLHSEETICAVQADMFDIVHLLIAMHADVNAQNDYCRTALEYAVELRRNDIAALLRNAGAMTSEESA